MKEMRYGQSRLSKFLKRNGVYMALAVGLVSLSVVVLLGMVPTETKTEEQPQAVEQTVTGQPDDRVTTTTTETVVTTTTTTVVQNESADLYVFPLSNTVQKKFSVDAPLYSETMNDWRIHCGVDFAGEEGQTVKATARGTVASVEKDSLWGDVITIDHGVGVLSRYCGVKATVAVGDEVEASTPIGTLQTVPCEASQKLHLHMEMTVDGAYIDPVSAIALEVRYGETTKE